MDSKKDSLRAIACVSSRLHPPLNVFKILKHNALFKGGLGDWKHKKFVMVYSFLIAFTNINK